MSPEPCFSIRYFSIDLSKRIMPLVLYCGQYELISSGEFLHKQNSQLRGMKLFPASFIPSFLLVAQIPADHQSHNSAQYISVREHLYPIE